MLLSACLIVAGLLQAARLEAQTAPALDRGKPGLVFVYGGALLASILDDKQDTGRGYLHDNFIGQLDRPAAGRWWAAACSSRIA